MNRGLPDGGTEAKAEWLSSIDNIPASEKYGGRAAYFRREFGVPADTETAELLITAAGAFRAYLNGEEIDCGELSPGWTDYGRRIPLFSFDVTDKIRRGERNCIGAVLGDGWYCGTLGLINRRRFYGDAPALYCVIKISSPDKTEYIVSDERWSRAAGEIQRNDILHGEAADKREALGNFYSPSYDGGSGKWLPAEAGENLTARLFPADFEPIRLKARLPASEIGRYTDTDGEKAVYDCGQNFAGVAEIEVVGESGAEIVLRYGEMIDNGRLYTENLRFAEATDRVILAGTGNETFRPLFTYHGFRYVEVAVKGKAAVRSVTGLAFWSDTGEDGYEFNCSNPLINRIYSNLTWSRRSNFMSVPTDCPQRDERLGWTGDVQIFCKTAMWGADCERFFAKYLRDIRDAQRPDGAVPVVVPDLKAPWCEPYTGCNVWGDVITFLTYGHYGFYGGEYIIRDNLSAIKRWIEYCERKCGGGLIPPDEGFGDWLSAGEETSKILLAAAHFYRSAVITAELCGIVGDRNENAYKELAGRIGTAFKKRFIDFETGRLTSDTQTAYLVANAFLLIGAETAKPNLLRCLEHNGNRLATGFVGIKYLLPALCDFRETNRAYALIRGTEYPSWGYSILNGATTVWERWNSYTKESGFGDAGMNSFNHYSFGSCGEWFYEYVLGIKRGSPGFKTVVFRPSLLFEKGFGASGKYASPNGEIEVKWRNSDGGAIEYAAAAAGGIKYDFDLSEYDVIDEKRNGRFHIYSLKEQ